MIADLGTAILAALGWPGGISVLRQTGAYADGTGLWVTAGGPTTLTLAAVVDVSPGKANAMLPEGEQSDDAVLIFTAVPLRAANSEAGFMGDVVTWNGARWRVGAVRDYVPLTGHCQAACTRIWEDA